MSFARRLYERPDRTRYVLPSGEGDSAAVPIRALILLRPWERGIRLCLLSNGRPARIVIPQGVSSPEITGTPPSLLSVCS